MVQDTQLIMGMPITITLSDVHATTDDLTTIFDYFQHIDEQFSPYKETSEVSKINRHDIVPSSYSPEMQEVIHWCRKTQEETFGFFNPWHNNVFDPSGVVKGWAIQRASDKLKEMGLPNHSVDAGGDIALSGHNEKNEDWHIGIKNPFKQDEIIKVLLLTDMGIATSGTYIRGQHIYNPYHPDDTITEIVSLTVLAQNVFEADRFATPAFAMGRKGIEFIQDKEGLEGYMIDSDGVATYSDGFKKYVLEETV